MGFIGRLFDSNDLSTDAPVVMGVGSVAAYWGIAIYHIAQHPDQINFTDLGGGCAAIIVAIAGARWFRGKNQPPDQPPGA